MLTLWTRASDGSPEGLEGFPWARLSYPDIIFRYLPSWFRSVAAELATSIGSAGVRCSQILDHGQESQAKDLRIVLAVNCLGD